MNRIIIIGNGFDLAHGLKTSFYDFIGDYLISIIEGLSSSLRYNDDLIKIVLASDKSNILNCDFENIEQIIDLITWGGDEIKVKDSDDFYSEVDNDNHIDRVYISKLLRECLDDVKNKGWVDIEQVYFDLLLKLIEERNSYNQRSGFAIKSLSASSVNEINAQLNILKERLEKYLEKIQKEEINAEVQLLKQFQQENRKRDYIGNISGKFPSKYYFLNFNYTNTIDKYLIHINNDVNYDLNHIHGSLCGKHGSPIFGYADDLNEDFKAFEKEKINELYDNIKTFAYNEESNYANLMRTLNEGDFQVAIYGHSCGLSDRTLLNRIFEHKNCKSIKVFYYQNGEKDDFAEKRYAIYRLFEDKTLLNDRLVNKKDSEPMVQPIKVSEEGS